MNWQNLSVFQFQQLFDLKADQEEIDLMAETVAICYNMTAHEVDSLSIGEFNEKCAALSFLNTPPEWEPVKNVTVNGTRYRFVYDVRQIHASRYIEVKQFSTEGLIPGLHKMAASMVVPQKRNWCGKWVDADYDATKHADYAADMQAAPITAIHGSALFFCKVFINSIEVLQDYLTSTIPESQREEARQVLLDSCRILAGNITPALWQSMSESHSMPPTTSPSYNSLTT